MSKVGIIGGIGPASTLEYYREIIEGYRGAMGARNYPKIEVNSVDMTEMLSFIEAGDYEGLVGFLLSAVRELARAGADFGAIASNTPHVVFDRVQALSPIPLISIVESTCESAASLGLRKLLLIGTWSTMAGRFYQDALAAAGIEAFVPSEEGRRLVHGTIFPDLEEGIVLPEKKKVLTALCGKLIDEARADGIILGCTELPLMLGAEDFDVAVLDTTRIHIDRIVERLANGSREEAGAED